MAYTKQTWADLPSKTTPINAERLTHIEDGIYSAAQTADTAASTAGTAAANVGIVSGRVETLTERVNGLDTAVSNKVDKVTGKDLSTNDYTNTDKAKVDALGTASTKNSTSVVTQSTDLVESGAVYDVVESAYQLTKDSVGWSGKNRLPMTISELKRLNTTETWSGNVYVRYGITFSVTTDNDGNVTEIDAHGTSTGAVYFSVGNMNIGSSAMDSVNNPKANGYILSAHASVHLKYSTSSHNFVFDIPNGTQLNHAKLYPMLRRDNVIDATFEPYHPSVDAQKADNSVIGTVEDGTNPTKSYAVGEHMIRGGKFCTVTVPVTTSSTWTLGSNYVEGTIADNLVKRDTFSATTSASGNFRVSEDNTRVILRVIDTGHIIIPYKTSDDKNNAHVMNADMTAVANSLVSGTYYYI